MERGIKYGSAVPPRLRKDASTDGVLNEDLEVEGGGVAGSLDSLLSDANTEKRFWVTSEGDFTETLEENPVACPLR